MLARGTSLAAATAARARSCVVRSGVSSLVSGAGVPLRAGATAASSVLFSSDAALDAAKAAARQSVKWDPSPLTAAATEELLELADRGDAAAGAELRDAFTSRLSFGTAGLRGKMGPGTFRMNDLSVVQAAQGLSAYLQEANAHARSAGVVIGYDHRARADLLISSQRFALLTAEVFLEAGFKVYLYGDTVATPLVPFAVEKYGCAAGVMVTASHNPKDDNGFKVYWSNGSQIISPHDVNISNAIEANLEPASRYDGASVRGHENCVDPLADDIVQDYMGTLSTRLCRHKLENADGGVKMVYTAMHGVGRPWVAAAFDAFDLPAFIPVAEQVEPDPTFPTVTLPNPEEGKGALALAMKTADEHGASLILASDPDADRLAVAERDPDSGEWGLLSGNDIGTLLGHWQWQHFDKANSALPVSERTAPEDVYMLAPAVASKMLASIAQHHGFNFEETLTGFKWAGFRTAHLRDAGKTVLFAYEPEIGFCVGDVVKDKDGVCAAAVFAEMALAAHREGQTVRQRLESLKDVYGHFIAINGYYFCHDKAVEGKIFERLRNGGEYWTEARGYDIVGIRDLTEGVETSAPDGKPYLPTSKSSQYLTYYFGNGATVTFRTSGTEPKLKYYSELKGSNPHDTRRVLEEMLGAVLDDMLEPESNGLEKPKDS